MCPAVDWQRNEFSKNNFPIDRAYGRDTRLGYRVRRGFAADLKATGRHANTTQTLPIITGDSWKAQHPATLHFGLGKSKAIDTIEVRWPNGKTNRYHVIKSAQ
jgi:hypothetical protein|tara:strand:+ start:440 stop:748 length:309 start_codon:yes stop_codon:yes gene_type:complete